jgi:transposase
VWAARTRGLRVTRLPRGCPGRPATPSEEASSSATDRIPDHEFTVFCCLDAGKSAHHVCALGPAGRRLRDQALPNDGAALVEVLAQLSTRGTVLVVVVQPASIGELAVARDWRLPTPSAPAAVVLRSMSPRPDT